MMYTDESPLTYDVTAAQKRVAFVVGTDKYDNLDKTRHLQRCTGLELVEEPLKLVVELAARQVLGSDHLEPEPHPQPWHRLPNHM